MTDDDRRKLLTAASSSEHSDSETGTRPQFRANKPTEYDISSSESEDQIRRPPPVSVDRKKVRILKRLCSRIVFALF